MTAPTQAATGPAAVLGAGPAGEGLLAAALAYAARGWHVIPLRPGSKVPAFPDHPADACTSTDPRCARAGAHVGWQDRATLDADRIIRAWSRPPAGGGGRGFGVGIACGPSRLVVLDLDVPKPTLTPAARRQLEERLAGFGLPGPATGADVLAVILSRAGQELPPTYTVGTPSGGRHLYYAAPDGQGGPVLGNTARALGPLIDTRAAGGQVVAPPTRIADGMYVVLDPAPVAVLPPWLAAALAPTPATVTTRATTSTSAAVPGGSGAGYLRAAVRAEVSRVTRAGEGERNHALLVASIALGQLVAGGALDAGDVREVLTEAAAGHVAAGAYTARQAQQTITSGLRRGSTRPRQAPAPDRPPGRLAPGSAA